MSNVFDDNYTYAAKSDATNDDYRQLHSQLKQLGLDWVECLRSEARMLPGSLHKGEVIRAVISGRAKTGHIMLVATDTRVIMLDHKPFFQNVEDISYQIISGVSVGKVGPFYTVTLNTRMGDYILKTYYGKAAATFKEFIESRCIENRRYGYQNN